MHRKKQANYIEDIKSYQPDPAGGGYSHILAIRVCAAGEGMIFKLFGLV